MGRNHRLKQENEKSRKLYLQTRRVPFKGRSQNMVLGQLVNHIGDIKLNLCLAANKKFSIDSRDVKTDSIIA